MTKKFVTKPILERLTYTPAEVSQLLGTGRSATYEAIRSGQIKAVRIGHKFYIPVGELKKLLSIED